MIVDVSVVIPCRESIEHLSALINALLKGDALPKEIIIVDSTDTSIISIKDIDYIVGDKLISSLVKKVPNAYPGKARNIGVQLAKNNLIGFLDVKTIPNKNWLSSSIELLTLNQQASGVWGMTKYQVSNKKEWIIRCATFGENPVKTVPGTIMRIHDINKVGNFLPTTRAGEDTDWIKRSQLQQIYMLDSKSPLVYKGLLNFGFGALFAKWFRNYTHSAKLPYLYAHKNIYYHGVVLIGLLTAFNWNWVVANWDIESNFYIPHITKGALISLSFIYVLIRGVLLPIRKGCKVGEVLPLNWIYIFIVSMVLDVVKVLGFLKASLYRAE
jgi:glycosyltransferase involved in cell wall biosynthesis